MKKGTESLPYCQGFQLRSWYALNSPRDSKGQVGWELLVYTSASQTWTASSPFGFVLKCRFWSSRPWCGLRCYISNQLPGDAGVAGTWTTLWIVRVLMILGFCPLLICCDSGESSSKAQVFCIHQASCTSVACHPYLLQMSSTSVGGQNMWKPNTNTEGQWDIMKENGLCVGSYPSSLVYQLCEFRQVNFSES